MPTDLLFGVRGLCAAHPGGPEVLHDIDLDLPRGSFVAVIGPNGCGKSTLLLCLARLLRPSRGTVDFNGQPLNSATPRALARRLAFLPQQPLAPDGIRVRDLVMRGRHPHRRLLLPPGAADHQAVDEAMAVGGVADLADARLAELSGGQRQRAWIAMALAQQTSTILVDEPTSFLDIAHQVDVLETCSQLVARGHDVIAVLHDLSLACRHADLLVVMSAGRVVAVGSPTQVMTVPLVMDVFDLPCRIISDPETSTPLVVPRRHHTAASQGTSPITATKEHP
ncbi:MULTISPECIES: ABC transporter ATP-binding protein [unclassified Luteococcus]|uniref:ABC transporter ATP-binding protein n=1 Tax=unclassified Luteococcus TaxID=2639923 RepID=UPI00313C0890